MSVWGWIVGLWILLSDDEDTTEETESEPEDLDEEGNLASPNDLESENGIESSKNTIASEDVWRNFVKAARTDHLYSPEDIILGKIKVPEEPGLYAWYVDALPGNLKDNFNCNGWTILYIGIASKNKNSTSNLYKRIRGIHLGNQTGASTLRYSLAFLLKDELNLQIFQYGNGKEFYLGRKGEKVLTNWMKTNCRVYWQIKDEPWLIEKEILKRHGDVLHLNISDNKHSPTAKKLSINRSLWKHKCLNGNSS